MTENHNSPKESPDQQNSVYNINKIINEMLDPNSGHWQGKQVKIQDISGLKVLNYSNLALDQTDLRIFEVFLNIFRVFFADLNPTIIVGDRDVPSSYSTDGFSKINGAFSTKQNTILLFPCTLSETSHRIAGLSNCVGTLLHEFAHFLYTREEIKQGWLDMFKWEQCKEDVIWEKKNVEHFRGWKWVNTQDTEPRESHLKIAYFGLFPSNPETCINNYGKIAPWEDFSESFTAFFGYLLGKFVQIQTK